MIIATNKAQFVNLTNGATGLLRTPGDLSTAANEKFLGFKPAAVCKKSGYLRITGYGSIASPAPATPLTIRMVFNRTPEHSFWVQAVVVSSAAGAPGQNSLFSFHVDIPVGTSGHSELNTLISTSHFNNTSVMLESWAYISAEPDDVWTASFVYETPTAGNFAAGQIKIVSVIAEYKEN
jgi:hypothetical protein